MEKGLQQLEITIFRKLLTDRNLAEVARRIGLAQPTLHNFFHGKSDGNRHTLDALRRYFKEEYKVWETYHLLTKS